MNTEEEIESIHETILKTQAKCDALEVLCLALIQTHQNPKQVLDYFLLRAADTQDSLLYGVPTSDEYVRDAVLPEFEKAHEAIAGQVRSVIALIEAEQAANKSDPT